MEQLTEKEWIIIILGCLGSNIMSKYFQFNPINWFPNYPIIDDVLNIILICLITFFILYITFEIVKYTINYFKPQPKRRYIYLSPKELNEIAWYKKMWSNIQTK